jgi:thioredoxin 1
MKKVNNVNEFNEVINSDNLTVVKFSADWCGPCRTLAGIMDDVTTDYQNVNFIEVDVEGDGMDEIVSNYSIRNIPVLAFIKNGKLLNKNVGLVDKVKITELINNNL